MNDEEKAKIARIDERTKIIYDYMTSGYFVSQHEFKPVRMVVYGIISLGASAGIAMLVAFV